MRWNLARAMPLKELEREREYQEIRNEAQLLAFGLQPHLAGNREG